MAKFTRQELERAFETYCQLRERSSASGDWSIWGGQFTENAHYVEHAYGEFHGRKAIIDWIVGVMAPWPHMTFPNDWVMIDPEKGWITFQCQNRLEHPGDPNGKPFQFPSWSLIKYAGDGFWSYEEDMYNPWEGGNTIKAWLTAGGKMVAPERVKMVKA